jgi:hypothetical protein
MRLGLLFAIIIAALSLAATGCIKVSHLGDQTARSFDSVFARQQRHAGALERPKAMEAELGTQATRTMVTGTQARSTKLAVAGGPAK